jgi:hypothetical protein
MSEIYSYTVPHSGVNTTYYFEDTDLRRRVADAEAYIGYTDSDIAGLEVDFENNTFTRLAGAVGKSGGSDFNVFPTYAGMRRCILADDGTVVAYYGEQGYVEDGTAGQVMVEIPKFYYRMIPLSLEKQTQEYSSDTNRLGYHIKKARWYITSTPHTGFKTHPLFIKPDGTERDKAYVSAYEGCVYDVSESTYLLNDEQVTDFTSETGDKLSSIAGAYPCSGKTKSLYLSHARGIAHNRGTGWQVLTIKALAAVQLLCAIEYASFNWQSSISEGVVKIKLYDSNYASKTGSTSSLGNSTGRAASTIDYNGTEQTAENLCSNSYRGIENFFGNMKKLVDGANLWGDGTMDGGTVYICMDEDYVSSKRTDNYVGCGFTITNRLNNYIKYFGYGEEQFDWLFFPSRVGSGATSTLPVGDAPYQSADVNSDRVLVFGGNWSYGTGAGGHCWSMAYTPTSYDYSVGARLVYLG